MTNIASRLAALAAGVAAIAFAVLGAWFYIELRELRTEHAGTVQQLATKTESNGVLKAQLATSQSDLAAMTDAAGKSSASVVLFASQASAALAAASDAKANAIQQSAGYQKQIDALTQRIDHPSNEPETCDAALDRLRSSL
jgi:DNA-binding helix-hairpin-helix protein with protein kinase domain